MTFATPPHNGTDTSRAAAEAIAPHAPNLRDQVFDYIRAQGVKGATIDEVSIGMGLKTATVCPRFYELKGGAYGNGETARTFPVRIVPNGMKRETSSGHSAVCWIAVDR